MTTLVGQKVRMTTDCKCGADTAVIGASDGKYYATLTCSCGRGRGSLTQFTGEWIEAVATKFGALATITLRHAPIPPIQAEQPPANAGRKK
jgi:hypothetical protein